MNKPGEPRTELLVLQVLPDVREAIEHAAALQGCSVSAFVGAAALEIARRTIDETHRIRLSPEDQRRFVDLLLNPPPMSAALMRAREARGRLIGKL